MSECENCKIHKRTYKAVFEVCGMAATVAFSLEIIYRTIRIGYIVFTGGSDL